MLLACIFYVLHTLDLKGVFGPGLARVRQCPSFWPAQNQRKSPSQTDATVANRPWYGTVGRTDGRREDPVSLAWLDSRMQGGLIRRLIAHH